MGEATCPACGSAVPDTDLFCGKCGASLTAATIPTPIFRPTEVKASPLARRRMGRYLGAIVVIVLLAAAAYYLVFLPRYGTVTTEGGTWVVNGASGALPVTVGCSNCGVSPAPGSTFTVDLNVQVGSATCGSFGCPGYRIQAISLSSPYVLAAVSPNNLPYDESQGGFNTWALTIQAPNTPGHFPLGGIVAVSYY